MGDVSDLGALTRDAARFDVEGRELIVATGADRIRFLHGLVTGNVAGTPVGGGCRSVLLTLKGHVVSDIRIFVRPDDIWMVVASGQAEATAATLSRYAIMDDFVAAPRADFKLLGLLGPSAAARLAEAGLPVGDLATRPLWSHAELQGLWLVRARELGAEGFWIGGSPDATAALDLRLAQAGVPRLAPAAAEAARIAALEPRWGAEITPDYFPMEVGLGDAIDYDKGCYLGQEPIVRIRDRGHINWRLVALDFSAPRDPAPNDRLESDLKAKAGRITSAAHLPDGRGVALGLLHTSVPVGSQIRIHHGDESIAALVRAEIA